MARAIVRYGPRTVRAASRYGSYLVRYNKRARLAYGAIQYGPRVIRAASNIARWYRRRRGRRPTRFSRSQIGHRVNESTGKRYTIEDSINNYNTRTLYKIDLTNIPKTTSNEIDSRQRDIVNLRGFKFCIELQNRLERPLYFNYAVLSPKNGQTVSEENFFRGSGNGRGLTFSNLLLSSNDFHCRPINADEYIILRHKRYRLSSLVLEGGSNYTENSGKNYMNIMKYVKLKRQIRYDGLDAQSSPVVFVFWFDSFLREPESPVEQNALSHWVLLVS